MAKKETTKQFTLGDLIEALKGHTLDSAVNTLLGSKGVDEHAKATGGKGKGKPPKDEEEEEEEEDDDDNKSKGKGKGKGKEKPEKLDKKKVAEARKEAAKTAKAIDKLDDDDALEEVEDLLAEYEVSSLKEVADEDIAAVAAKLEDILEDYE